MAEVEETLKRLEFIYSYYESLFANPEEYTKEISDAVAAGVSEYSKRRDWTWRYFVSLKNRTLKPSKKAIRAIEKKYKKIKKLTKKPRRKPLDTEIAKRTLVICATLDELHEIQDRYTPLDRANRLLEER